MIAAAIYARKSTDQNVPEPEKSVARQVEHGRAYAAGKGWSVPDQFIFVDDGISGAEFVKRPGLARLMNALSPKPPFGALIMSEESRLGREQIETAWVLKQITDAGVRVFFYLSGQERTLDSAMDKVMLSLTNFAAEMEREKGRQRTHDAMLKKARARHVTGGRVYGYDNAEIIDPTSGKRARVDRIVNPAQADIVRRVFALYADGWGLTRIAKSLNDEGIPPPRGGNGWAPSALREMVRRPLYRGEIVWNKSKKTHRGGTKKQIPRPADEWERISAPELRIISDSLWDTVQAQILQRGATFAPHSPAADRVGRPDLESPYLLSGMAYCSECRGPLISATRSNGNGRVRVYQCAHHQKRGKAVCRNSVVLRQETLDDALIETVRSVLDERVVSAALDDALLRLRDGQEPDLDQRGRIARELALIESRKARLVEAIARGDDMEDLVSKLRTEEARRAALLVELGSLAVRDNVASLDAHRIKKQLGARAAEMRAVLGERTPETRQLLRRIVRDRIHCEPFREDGSVGYRYTIRATFGALLTGSTSW
jgi:site-specific DNA recombinase